MSNALEPRPVFIVVALKGAGSVAEHGELLRGRSGRHVAIAGRDGHSRYNRSNRNVFSKFAFKIRRVLQRRIYFSGVRRRGTDGVLGFRIRIRGRCITLRTMG